MICLPNLELLQERFYNHIKSQFQNKPDLEFQLTTFVQTWSSTALGFSMAGGRVITSAYTTVIWDIHSDIYGVFFGDSLAYVIKNPNDLFFEDLKNQDMKPCMDSSLYQK